MGIAGGGLHRAGFFLGIGARDQKHAAPGNRAATLEVGCQRDIEDRDRSLRRAFHQYIALTVGLEVGSIHLQLFRRHFQHHLAGFLGRLDDGIAGAVRAARGEGAHAVRAGIGVGGVDDDAVCGHADRFGADLRHDLLHALAEIDAGKGDHEVAGRRRMDKRLGRIATKVHAGWIVDRSDAASTPDRHLRLPSCRRTSPCIFPRRASWRRTRLPACTRSAPRPPSAGDAPSGRRRDRR